MDYTQVEKYWRKRKERMQKYTAEQLNDPRLLEITIKFLVECGMPESCAPMLSFDNWGKNTIPSLKNSFHRVFDWLDNYLHIGDNNSGDPICIDLNNNSIIYLNHDSNFELSFINSSIEKLAECLIVYTDFIEHINASDDSNFLNAKFEDKDFEKLKNQFLIIDEHCLIERTMWRGEFDSLLWERENSE
jgi:SUKH-4 immunity protein